MYFQLLIHFLEPRHEVLTWPGFPKNGGCPITGWLFGKNPIEIGMMTGGSPTLGNPHMFGDAHSLPWNSDHQHSRSHCKKKNGFLPSLYPLVTASWDTLWPKRISHLFTVLPFRRTPFDRTMIWWKLTDDPFDKNFGSSARMCFRFSQRSFFRALRRGGVYNLKANMMLEDLYLTGNPCVDPEAEVALPEMAMDNTGQHHKIP